MDSKFDTDDTDILICPHCGYENYDCFELAQGRGLEFESITECPSCGKNFRFVFEARPYWTSVKL